MTLGLGWADDDGIYLVIDSKGIEDLSSNKLHSKLLILQPSCIEPRSPEVVALIAGGLAHFCPVADQYRRPLPSVSAAAYELKRILDDPSVMNSRNQAYALVCGYECEQPVCYRVERPKECDAATVRVDDPLKTGVGVGMPKAVCQAKNATRDAIKCGEHSLVAMSKAILALASPTGEIRAPLSTHIIKPTSRQIPP